MREIRLADRLLHIEASPTLALAAKAKELAKSGKPVLNFTAGEPDFPTPENIKIAGAQAIEANRTNYTPAAGIPELREAIAQLITKETGRAYSASQVIVSCGAKHALFNIFQALCRQGDEVIVLSPYWVSYPPIVWLSGATPIIVETHERDGFQPDIDAVRKAITPSTRAIILNSPSNPTGTVIKRDRLLALARLALERHLLIVSDEIYDKLVFEPAKHISVVGVEPAVLDQTVLVGGVSKSFSMTGWRIGYALGSTQLINAMAKLQSHSTSNATSISQYAALAAIQGDQDGVVSMRKAFQERRDRLVDGLNKIPGLSATMPEGAFYVWCNIGDFGKPAAKIAGEWLNDLFVATVPGEGFGLTTHIRISFAASMDAIDEGLSRLGQWAKQKGAHKCA